MTTTEQTTNTVMRKPIQGSNLKAQGENVITATNEWLNKNIRNDDNFSVYGNTNKYTANYVQPKTQTGFINPNGESVAFSGDYKDPGTIELVKEAAKKNVKNMINARKSYIDLSSGKLRLEQLGYDAYMQPDIFGECPFVLVAYKNGQPVDADNVLQNEIPA